MKTAGRSGLFIAPTSLTSWGAPSLRFVQGRARCCLYYGVDHAQRSASHVQDASSALKFKGRASESGRAKGVTAGARGTRPCTGRKSGAPTLLLMPARPKGWATRHLRFQVRPAVSSRDRLSPNDRRTGSNRREVLEVQQEEAMRVVMACAIVQSKLVHHHRLLVGARLKSPSLRV